MQGRPFVIARRHLLVGLAAAVCGRPQGVRARTRVAAEATGPLPTLATVYAGQVEPSRCLVSEKYDGVRALWDGRVLRHRSGRTVNAPASFLAALAHAPLDGELWLGRGRFDALSAIVRRAAPRADEWQRVRYMAFEMPGVAGPFAERVERLASVIERRGGGRAELAPQRRIVDRAALQRAFDEVVGGGGEGLMLHVADAPYAGGRSDALLKLKPQLDAEARVVGHQRGAGKYRDAVGALEVESAAGRRFFVGSGLSDALRRAPPPIGSLITYRYRDLTPSGLPRFATYLRRYERW